MRVLRLFIKRTFDIVCSVLGIIALFPFVVFFALLIGVDMGGNPFFTQKRIGRKGCVFIIFKLKTMRDDQDAERNFDFSKDEQRVTKLGRFLRRSKIDETLQFLNILLGHMSFVGPRPTVQSQVEQYTPFEMRRLEMRPGLTGLAQVNGNTALLWEERIVYDVQYVDTFSLLLDIRILLKTMMVVLYGDKSQLKHPSRNTSEKV